MKVTIAYIDEPPFGWTKADGTATGADIDLADAVLKAASCRPRAFAVPATGGRASRAAVPRAARPMPASIRTAWLAANTRRAARSASPGDSTADGRHSC